MKKIGSAAALAVALLASVAVSRGAGGGLEGRWLLVEQTYGKGESNLVSADEPVILEILPGAGELGGRWLAPGGDPASASIWPAWRAEGRLLPVQVLEREIVPGGRRVRAAYLVAPSEGDGMLLEVEEAYELEPAGDVLSGTVKVVFREGGQARGAYTLHRRFERLR